MRLINRHKRHAVVLALIALSLQMVIAFDHVHLRGVAQYAGVAVTQRGAAQSHSPTPSQSPGENEDYCAACASIFLASSAFAPAPPQLPLPVAFERVERIFEAAAAFFERQHLGFRSRAPPVA
jgi:hypothetical protein